MTFKTINKLAIIISWPRELDMLLPLIKSLPKNKVVIIANDCLSIEKGRVESNKLIIKLLKKKKVSYELFSKIYKAKKYKVLISTGEINGKKISFYSLLRFFYAFTFGHIVEKTSLAYIFEKIIGKPLTGDGLNAKLGLPWFPEKEIGEIVVKYPDGADIKEKNYPYDVFKKVFNIYLSFTDFEISLIRKKFTNIRCKKIENPRFINLFEDKSIFKEFHKNKFFDKNKKNLYWLPTVIDIYDEIDINVKMWMQRISFLKENFNLIIRPHPKTFLRNKFIIKDLENSNFIVDSDQNRKIGNLIKDCDLILCDYGGAVFDSLYLKKPMLFLNLNKNSLFDLNQKKAGSIDIQLREKLLSLNINDSKKDIKKKIFNCLTLKYKKKIFKISNSYFGSTKAYNIKKLSKYLVNLLD